MSLQQWITYCIAIFAGGMIPGPITLMAMSSGAQYGIVKTIPVAAGNVAASILQVLVSIALIGSISKNSDMIFKIMLFIGGVYLIYIAYTVYRSDPFRSMVEKQYQDVRPRHNGFIEVFSLTLLNPKAIMFFVALFPQVIPSEDYSVILIAIMTIIFSMIALVCFVIYAVFGSLIRGLAGDSAYGSLASYTVAIVFFVMGVSSLLNVL